MLPSPLHIVLVEPEIPPNTGNIGRLCVGAGVELHLVEPLGFSLEDRALKRAGLDYWEHLQVTVWPSFDAYLAAALRAGWRMFALSTKARMPYTEAEFRPGDHLLFGRETKGLPEPFLRGGHVHSFRIPMRDEARSYNLATAVGIVLFEGLRQISALPQ